MKKPHFIQEKYPTAYEGYQFITLIQFNDKDYLTIVDNVDIENVYAFVLDHCNDAKLNELEIITICDEWYNSKSTIPFSLYAMKADLDLNDIVRVFPKQFITRLIGPLFTFHYQKSKKVRRRKVPNIGNIVVIKKSNK